MDWLTFIERLIGHLAWPLVVAGLGLLLFLRHRVALDSLLHRVRKARAGPFFEAELDEAKAEAERANLPAEPTALSTEGEEERRRQLRYADPEEWLSFFMGLADRDPFGAVHGSFHFMNGYLYEAANRLEPELVRLADDISGWGQAVFVGLLTPEHEKVRERLSDAVRSANRQDDEVSRRQAREFILLVARLVSAVQERLRMLLEAHEPRSTDTPAGSPGRPLRPRRGSGPRRG